MCGKIVRNVSDYMCTYSDVRWIYEYIGCIDEWMDGWKKNEWIDGWMDEFMDGRTDRWVGGCVVGWIDRWKEEWVGG